MATCSKDPQVDECISSLTTFASWDTNTVAVDDGTVVGTWHIDAET